MVESSTLLDRFPEMLERCGELRVEVGADSGLFTIDERHAREVERLFKDVVGLLLEIEERYAPADREGEDDLALVDCSIADLAFLGRLELEGIATQFAEARAKNRVWDVLRYADMGATQAWQALRAVEGSTRKTEGLGAREHDDLDLGPALEVRRQYAILRNELSITEEPSGDDLLPALEAVLKKITEFRDHEIYAQVRVDDRLQIRSLQKRIRAVTAGQDGENPDRLWEDIDAAIGLLLHINRRTVLEDHDGRLVAALGTQVDSTRHLSSLVGRSAELDRFLLGKQGAQPEELTTLIEGLRAQLLD